MPPPPLSPDERRLGQFALATAALYTGSGLFFAALPHLTLKLAAFGAPVSMGPGARMWHALSISMMGMLALCSYLAGRAPRENRRFLLPVILSKGISTCMAALTLLSWRASHAEAWAGRRTLWSAIATDLPLFVATAYLYWKAAPGVNAISQFSDRSAPPDAPKPVALGIARPPAPAPLPAATAALDPAVTAAAAAASENKT
jgi:hypothetical protein